MKNFIDLNISACTFECEPYFEMRFQICFASGTCASMKEEIVHLSNTSALCISSLLVQLHSNEFINDSIINVSANMFRAIWECTIFAENTPLSRHSQNVCQSADWRAF